MSKHLTLRAALATLLLLPVAACGPQAAVQTTTQGATPKPVAGVNGTGATGGLGDDDPSGLRTGKVQPLKPPPPPLAATQQASGQEVGQDLATALNADQEMDMYAVSLDKGNGIVASGAGNIVASGAGNYVLLEEPGATTAATATTKPSPTPTPTATAKVEASASAAASPKPTKAARTPLPSLAPKFVPRLDALFTEEKRAQLIARAQLQNARLTQRAQKLPETKAIKAAAANVIWTANGDGTYGKTFEAEITKKLGGKPATGKLTVQATVDDSSDTLVHHLARIELALEGSSRSVTRELVVAGDGSRHITFHLEEWDAQGRKRVVDFSKTLDLQGTLTGTGSATRYAADGSTLRSVAVTLAGAEDAPQAKAVDANSKLETNVSLAADGGVKAQVRDAGTTASAEVTVAADAAPQDDAVKP
ncbi:MAG: hypothetical protein JWM80_3420 [Cyanobacteria bacterium RYN_339]|nr:hypothetical protein [Cyanobacteria bacterium RYN_339]